jgi:CubicO group peptidase (beta-lactamase class C family)
MWAPFPTNPRVRSIFCGPCFTQRHGDPGLAPFSSKMFTRTARARRPFASSSGRWVWRSAGLFALCMARTQAFGAESSSVPAVPVSPAAIPAEPVVAANGLILPEPDAGLMPDFPEPESSQPASDRDQADPDAAAPPSELKPEASSDFREIDALVERAIHEGKMPGAVVAVGRHDRVLFRRAYGQRSIIPVRAEMTSDTIFDLASLTKPLVTAALVLWLVDHKALQLSDPVSKYVTEFRGQARETVTVEQVLLHVSGLPPENSLRDYRDGAAHARTRVLDSWLEAYPGKRFIYSDVGFILLGALIERITGERLDRTAERALWRPLRMLDTHYCPDPCLSPRIAPTELAPGRRTSPIRGEVQDPRAYWLGGIAGNAGLFSSAGDLSRFARMLLGGGQLDGVRVLSAEAVRLFTEPHRVPGGGLRGLGWDVSTPFSIARGRKLSEFAYGHGGYTGTSLWIDPKLDLFVLFLSNRNHPFGATANVLHLEGAIADVAVAHLDASVRSAAPE